MTLIESLGLVVAIVAIAAFVAYHVQKDQKPLKKW